MIDLRNVTKTYAKNGVKALDDLTLNVQGGELFGFIGPNGAGKTTTIKLMTGILQPDAGTITMAGHRMDSERLEAQRLIGFVPDGNDVYDRLTGMEYLNFMADVYQVSAEQRKRHIEKYLNLFSLEDAQSPGVDPGRAHERPGPPGGPSAEGRNDPPLRGGEHRVLLHPRAGSGGKAVHPHRRDLPRRAAGGGHAG